MSSLLFSRRLVQFLRLLEKCTHFICLWSAQIRLPRNNSWWRLWMQTVALLFVLQMIWWKVVCLMLPMFLSVFLVVFIIEESGFAYLVANWKNIVKLKQEEENTWDANPQKSNDICSHMASWPQIPWWINLPWLTNLLDSLPGVIRKPIDDISKIQVVDCLEQRFLEVWFGKFGCGQDDGPKLGRIWGGKHLNKGPNMPMNLFKIP